MQIRMLDERDTRKISSERHLPGLVSCVLNEYAEKKFWHENRTLPSTVQQIISNKKRQKVRIFNEHPDSFCLQQEKSYMNCRL